MIAFARQDGSILDNDLYIGQPILHHTGMGSTPLYFPGGYACVFKYESPLLNKFWAVRCFLQSVPNVAAHYSKVSQRLPSIPCRKYFIDFKFKDEGIRIVDNNQIYPIVKMEWANGEDLRSFISKNLNDGLKLESLADAWVEMSRELKKANIAHGDIQHGNVLVDDSANLKLKLVDYDSLYFGSDGNTIDNEIHGYPEYQHPLRTSLKKQCLEMDFFPQLVVYISLQALIIDSSLWQQYNLDNADRRLLFEASDFQDPDNSNVLQHLSKLSSDLKELTNALKFICKLTDFSRIPSLDDVIDKISPSVTSWIPPRPQQTNTQPNSNTPQSVTSWIPPQPVQTNNTQTNPSNAPQSTTSWTPQQTNTQANSNTPQSVTSWTPPHPVQTNNTQANPPNIPQSTTSWTPQQTNTQSPVTPPQNANNNIPRLPTQVSSSQSQRLNHPQAITSPTKSSKTLQKWKIAAIAAIVTSFGFAGLSFWQYRQIEELKQKIEDRNKNWLRSENSFKSEIYTLKEDKSSLQNQASNLETKITQARKEIEQLNTDKQNLLSSRIDRLTFNGKVTSINSSSNPISHKFVVPRPSKLDIYLYNLASDADFDIVNERGQVLPNSERTKSSSQTEVMDSFAINSSGDYFVRVWLHSGSETAYALKIYRYS
jgi:hypothetical protein